jgi:hypothetical protein
MACTVCVLLLQAAEQAQWRQTSANRTAAQKAAVADEKFFSGAVIVAEQRRTVRPVSPRCAGKATTPRATAAVAPAAQPRPVSASVDRPRGGSAAASPRREPAVQKAVHMEQQRRLPRRSDAWMTM